MTDEPLAPPLPEEPVEDERKLFSISWLESKRQAIAPVYRDEIVGNHHAVEAADSLIWRLTHVAGMREYGAEPPRGALLFGGPGLGKTMLARFIATQLGVDVRFYNVPLDELSPSRIRGAIEHLDSLGSRSILYLDEIDGFAKLPGFGASENPDDRSLRLAFLSAMDGPTRESGALVLASTNLALSDIFPALVRSGRMSTHISFSPPTRDERLDLLRRRGEKRALSSDVDFEFLADITGDFSPADLVQGFDDALGMALSREDGNHEVHQRDLVAAFARRGLVMPERNEASPEIALRTLHHELGHAVANSVMFGPSEVTRLMLTGGGEAHVAGDLEQHPFAISELKLVRIMVVLAAGRITEQLVDEHVSMGSSSDYGKLTGIFQALVVNGLWPDLMDLPYPHAVPLSELRARRGDLVSWATECARQIVEANLELIRHLGSQLTSVLEERPAINGNDWRELLSSSPIALRTPDLPVPPLDSPLAMRCERVTFLAPDTEPPTP